jgi:sugar lactone lactonase YvrE
MPWLDMIARKSFPSFPNFRVRFPQVGPITVIELPFRTDLIATDQRIEWLAPSGAVIVASATAETDFWQIRQLLGTILMRLQFKSLVAAVALLFTCLPTAGAVDILSVTNLGNGTVTKYDAATGTYQSTFNSASAAYIAFDGSGNQYVTDYGGDKVHKYDAAGQLISTNSDAYIYKPLGIAFDSSGNYWVANGQGLRKNVFDPPLGYINQYDSSGTYVSEINLGGTGPFPIAEGLAIKNNGDLYISLYNVNKVVKYSSGSLSEFISSGLSAPGGLAFDSAGYLYVANSGANSIIKYDSSGTAVQTITTNLNAPRGLTIDSAGNLFAANAGDSTISKFDSSGVFLSSISTGVNVPIGVAINSVTVPEPSTYALAAIASGVMATVARRRKARQG